MSDEDDVPPLEDLSHAFKSLATTQAATSSATGGILPSQVVTTAQQPLTLDAPTSTQAKSTAASSGRQGQSCFGGMRSGFLTAKQKPRSKPPVTSTNSDTASVTAVVDADDGLPFIRANPEAASKTLRLDEVQDAMRSSTSTAADGILSGDRSWITDDLLGKIESNPDLLRRLADPRMSAALAKFQANPAAAMAEFGSDAEVQAFLKDFAAILGDHFTLIAEKQEKEAAAKKAAVAAEPLPDPEVAEVLSRPGVREALTNADVQRWLSVAKTDPERAQGLLRANRDPVFQGRIRLLFENGLLGIAK